ncbi:hypothetical protein [Myroides injenensis]|uniref:hypothetical protein n=1 Tax=Myroides injenensis TaxID=1183151 RepID=UPI000289014E|nr:hypothetical protein [Myroides injenensis]
MLFRFYTSFLLLLLTVNYSLAQNIEGDISLRILNDDIKDNSMVTLIIENNSNYDYWFPWDVSELAYNATLAGAYESTVFLIDQHLVDKENNSDIPLIIEANSNIDKVFEKWKAKTATKKINDFIVVKAHDFISLKIPFKLNYSLVPAWYSQEEMEKGEFEYFVSYQFIPKIVERIFGDKYLQIEQKGYHIYTHPLNSNKIKVTK